SRVSGIGSAVGAHVFIAGPHVMIAGAIVALAGALTGFWDWWKSTSPGNQARRTANWHMTVMLTVTGIVILDIIIRLAQWSDNEATSTIVMILSIIIGGLTAFGAADRGSLPDDHGFNVATAGGPPRPAPAAGASLPRPHQRI